MLLETEISQLTLFLSLVQQQNLLLHLEFSRKNLKRNMAKKKQQREFTLQQIRQRELLKNLATEEGYESFVVPDDVGGRFSVLTAVGLLPIAVSGADIDKLMEGAASGREKALNNTFEDNDAVKYAAIRNILLRKGKSIEITS